MKRKVQCLWRRRRPWKPAGETAAEAGRVKKEAKAPKAVKEEPRTPNNKRGPDQTHETPKGARTSPGSNRKSSVKRRRVRGKTPGSASKAREPAASSNSVTPPNEAKTAEPGQASRNREARGQQCSGSQYTKAEKATETKGTPGDKKKNTPEKATETKGTPGDKTKKHSREGH